MQAKVFISKSSEETQKIGEEFVSRSKILFRRTKSPIIIALYGDLGAGKTTFVQGLAKGLGIKKRILSPTFVLMREYEVRSGKCEMRRLYHVDLYRIESEKDIESLGLSEIWSDPSNIVAIEWAEKIENLLPKKRIDIHFEYLSDEKRKIRIEE